MRPARDRWVNPALALCVCAGAGFVFSWLRLPLPWMIGPLAAMALCNLAGAELRALRAPLTQVGTALCRRGTGQCGRCHHLRRGVRRVARSGRGIAACHAGARHRPRRPRGDVHHGQSSSARSSVGDCGARYTGGCSDHDHWTDVSLCTGSPVAVSSKVSFCLQWFIQNLG